MRRLLQLSKKHLTGPNKRGTEGRGRRGGVGRGQKQGSVNKSKEIDWGVCVHRGWCVEDRSFFLERPGPSCLDILVLV